MGTILSRRRKDGTQAHQAQVLIKRDGKVLHRETRTFDRRQAAGAWLEKREKELTKPMALERLKANDPPLADVIERYVDESIKQIGKTKAQCLRSIKATPLGKTACSQVTSVDIVAFCQDLIKTVKPQTVGNYLSHLGPIFSIARPAWEIELDSRALEDARIVAKKLGLTSKSKHRDRRPSLDELDKLMVHFGNVRQKRPSSTPMQKVIAFAMFSTRRQEEITMIKWADLDEANSRVLVRDMKHPGEKIGNDTWCDLPPEAMAIIKSMPRKSECIFPYTTDAIGAAFTRACLVLGINTEEMPDEKRLHFHDLRHDGVSRLFEMGWNIPHVAAVSGHRSWASLRRYTHIRQSGNKYEGWKWLPIITGKPSLRVVA